MILRRIALERMKMFFLHFTVVYEHSILSTFLSSVNKIHRQITCVGFKPYSLVASGSSRKGKTKVHSLALMQKLTSNISLCKKMNKKESSEPKIVELLASNLDAKYMKYAEEKKPNPSTNLAAVLFGRILSLAMAFLSLVLCPNVANPPRFSCFVFSLISGDIPEKGVVRARSGMVSLARGSAWRSWISVLGRRPQLVRPS